jgi:hypothetical protein
MSHPPFFHEASGSVRFWVLVEEQFVGASIGKETLHYCYRSGAVGDEALETYTLHAQDIDDAVRRRVAQGSTEPVMLREFDLHGGAKT